MTLLTDRMGKRFEGRTKVKPGYFFDEPYPNNTIYPKGSAIYNPRLNDIRILNRKLKFGDIKFSDTDEHPTHSTGEIWHPEDKLKFVMLDEDDNFKYIDIKPDEIKIDIFRSLEPAKADGTRSEVACRITHLPTGVIALCKAKNAKPDNVKDGAMELLSKKLGEYHENLQS